MRASKGCEQQAIKIIPITLEKSYSVFIFLFNGTEKEGTVSTASRNCRFHQQRLQAWRTDALLASESFGGGPWALGPKRLQWLTNITDGFKIAAFLSCASSLMAHHTTHLCNCGLEALAGTSPPTSFLQFSHRPP